MEKLIYVMVGDGVTPALALERLASVAVPAARAVGGEGMAVLVPDLSESIRERNKMRIGPNFDSLTAAFEVWLPCLDDRARIEEALRKKAHELWGYLVTESIVAPDPYEVGEGERVPGVTQWGINDKPARVELEDFYREWQEVHSKLSFDLHPRRDSYARNAVARRLTAEAPEYLAIVLERFPTLEDFTDDARYFGDPAVVEQMIDHLPTFYEFSTAITGAMSEYRFA